MSVIEPSLSQAEDKEASVLPTPVSLSLYTGVARTTQILPIYLHCSTLHRPGSRLSTWDFHKPWEHFPPNDISALIGSWKGRARWASPFYLGQELGLKDPSGLQPLRDPSPEEQPSLGEIHQDVPDDLPQVHPADHLLKPRKVRQGWT